MAEILGIVSRKTVALGPLKAEIITLGTSTLTNNPTDTVQCTLNNVISGFGMMRWVSSCYSFSFVSYNTATKVATVATVGTSTGPVAGGHFVFFGF